MLVLESKTGQILCSAQLTHITKEALLALENKERLLYQRNSLIIRYLNYERKRNISEYHNAREGEHLRDMCQDEAHKTSIVGNHVPYSREEYVRNDIRGIVTVTYTMQRVFICQYLYFLPVIIYSLYTA